MPPTQHHEPPIPLTPLSADVLQRVTAATGLTKSDVSERISRGAVNVSNERTSRSLADIAKANVFTRFNAILGVMFAIIVITGETADSLFGIVLVLNALIGIVQEWLAKRKLDQLAVLNAPHATVVRDGTAREIATAEVVLDDLLEIRSGDQLCVDGIVATADGIEVDESLLTGESDPILKRHGDIVLSGSIVVAGHGTFQATRVGSDAYARKLASEARQFAMARSELQEGTNRILGYVTWALVPAIALLFWSQLSHKGSMSSRLTHVVAGVVGMVPEGLVLLTSFAFLIAARTLAKRNVLVQELPAVEGLARVDAMCVDKTGTITEGSIVFRDVVVLTDAAGDGDGELVSAALGAIAADEHGNATAHALANAHGDPGWRRTESISFSSARKWSAVEFEAHGTWYIGAPEMVWARHDEDDPVRHRANELAADGLRVLLLARSAAPIVGESLADDLVAYALVTFQEQVRADAPETFRYFADQGVRVRVISGDNPITVGAVARRAGIANAERVFDARNLPEGGEELAAVLADHNVFGRVTPQQKRAIVQSLQASGHTVAMTGDGVNDALALKDADIGIAMGNGAPATRAVAQLVLLDGQFSRMPGVVAEGRRVIANVERVSNLYVTKTIYAFVIAIVAGIARWKYPFLPRHLTVVSTLTIGIPSFFLAFAPNTRRYVPGFVDRVLRFTVPAGCALGAATMAAYGIVRLLPNVTDAHASSVAAIVLCGGGLWVLSMLARPLNRNRLALVMAMAAAFAVVLGITRVRRFYELTLPTSATAWFTAAVVTAVFIGVVEFATRRTVRDVGVL